MLVTGGGGFLGRHIVRKLLERGCRVRVLGRRDYPDLASAGVDCRRGDLADAATVRDAVAGCGAVFHVAAIPGVWGDYDIYYRANFVGTRNVLDALATHGVRRLVYTSTPSVVYGDRAIDGGDESLPYPEHYLTPYAATKAMAEKLVLAASGREFAALAIRPHLMFGPGDTQLIPQIIARARAGRIRRVGDGKNLVSVSYVENVADAHLLALDKLATDPAVSGQAYFVNEPEPVNCWDFINRILVQVGLEPLRSGIPYSAAYAAGWLCEKAYRLFGRKGEPPMTRFLAAQLATSHWFKTVKAERELGWKPAVSLDEGIRRMLAEIG